MKRLDGKVALITGAASGMGAAIARLFSGEGARVLACDIQDDKGKSIVNAIRSGGGSTEYFHLDVSRSTDWQQAVGGVAGRFGALTTLVNCAGVYSPTTTIPLGRPGEPEDIGYCALYLCSDEARYVTGGDFVVDGGVTAM